MWARRTALASLALATLVASGLAVNGISATSAATPGEAPTMVELLPTTTVLVTNRSTEYVVEQVVAYVGSEEICGVRNIFRDQTLTTQCAVPLGRPWGIVGVAYGGIATRIDMPAIYGPATRTGMGSPGGGVLCFEFSGDRHYLNNLKSISCT